MDYTKSLYYKSPMKRNESMISTIHLQKKTKRSSRSSSQGVGNPTTHLQIGRGFQPEQYARRMGSNSPPKLKGWKMLELPPPSQTKVKPTFIAPGNMMMLGRIHHFLSFQDPTYFSGVEVETHAHQPAIIQQQRHRYSSMDLWLPSNLIHQRWTWRASTWKTSWRSERVRSNHSEKTGRKQKNPGKAPGLAVPGLLEEQSFAAENGGVFFQFWKSQ